MKVEGAVGVHGDDHWDDEALHVLGLRVEGFAELHDIDAALPEARGPTGGRRIRRAGRNLQL